MEEIERLQLALEGAQATLSNLRYSRGSVGRPDSVRDSEDIAEDIKAARSNILSIYEELKSAVNAHVEGASNVPDA